MAVHVVIPQASTTLVQAQKIYLTAAYLDLDAVDNIEPLTNVNIIIHIISE